MKRKPNVFLSQLPFPLFNHSACEAISSIPLAAGYLKAMAVKEKLTDAVDIKIADFVPNEFYGDAMLIDHIFSKSPDMIGFSLYSWNINRSLYINQKIKERLPHLRSIVGGPAVTTEYSHVEHPAVDVSVYGEGESVFIKLLQNLAYCKPRFDQIGNICYKNNGNKIINPNEKIVDDLNEIPSPYLSHTIDPKIYKRLWIETMRWCSYKCKYCLYPERSVRKNPFYSIDRIKNEIIFAKNRGVRLIDLHDSAFNVSPNFSRLCRVIAQVNSDRSLKFKVFLRAELIDQKTIEGLLSSNILSVEVGLQSTNPTALKNIGRDNVLNKFIKGVKMLKKAGIKVLVDFMLGLPGDSLRTISETISFLENHKMADFSAFTILSIVPGTQLWEERKKFGLNIQKNPPFYVLSTPALSFNDMKEAIDLSTEKTVSKLARSILNPENNSWFPFLYSYSNGRYPKKGMGVRKNDSVEKNAGLMPITQISVKVDVKVQTIQQIIDLAHEVKNKLANVVTLWFDLSGNHREILYIKRFLKIISSANPYNIWHILLEPKEPIFVSAIEEVQSSIHYEINHWDYLNVFNSKSQDIEYCRQASRVLFVLSFHNVKLRNLSRSLPRPHKDLIWEITLGKDLIQRDFFNDLFISECAGFLFDFAPEVSPKYIQDTLKVIQEKRGRRPVRFKNRMLQVIWDKDYDEMCACMAGEVDLIVSYDRNLSKNITFFKKEKVIFDYLEWKSSLKR